jgi:hypothetical protein
MQATTSSTHASQTIDLQADRVLLIFFCRSRFLRHAVSSRWLWLAPSRAEERDYQNELQEAFGAEDDLVEDAGRAVRKRKRMHAKSITSERAGVKARAGLRPALFVLPCKRLYSRGRQTRYAI